MVACLGRHPHASRMFVVTEADAAAIRAVFNQEGELSAAIELRRRFPGITDNAKARACVGAGAAVYDRFPPAALLGTGDVSDVRA